jgi:hypothetical protein
MLTPGSFAQASRESCGSHNPHRRMAVDLHVGSGSRRGRARLARRFVLAALACAVSLGGVVVSGHEEPCKTRWEKTAAERDRRRLVEAGVRAVTVWKHDVEQGTVGAGRSRAIRQEYDAHGRLVSISAFVGQAVSESAVYSYNPAGDMITDVDLDGRGEVTESNVFAYDAAGRVVSGYSHDASGRNTGRFEHRFDRPTRRITFLKYSPAGSVDYSIEYGFDGDYDAGDYVTAVKKTGGTTAVLQVEKRLDGQGRTLEKKVAQLDKRSAYAFRYHYDEREYLTDVVRVDASGLVVTTTRYAVEPDGLRTEAREYDAQGRVTACSTYEYERASSGR